MRGPSMHQPIHQCRWQKVTRKAHSDKGKPVKEYGVIIKFNRKKPNVRQNTQGSYQGDAWWLLRWFTFWSDTSKGLCGLSLGMLLAILQFILLRLSEPKGNNLRELIFIHSDPWKKICLSVKTFLVDQRRKEPSYMSKLGNVILYYRPGLGAKNVELKLNLRVFCRQWEIPN